MAVSLPGPQTRWRCALCGNLTRFDVVRTTRAQEYVHVDLAGNAVVDERRVVSEAVEHVTCRWCGAVDQVEVVPRPGALVEPRGVSDGSGPAGT
ncbi:MAG: hypothetical protein M3P95_07765 [Actinomycetota bacterium]|jgi:ribosomal protein S27E|nr:hypothetical protein [Actinomycetota bacterium]